jgi:ESF2/ABP1 family protein
MATRKRNEFLDAGDSENDERGYDSEEESRARMLPSAKRQKLDYDSQDESEQHDHDSDIEAHEESEDPNDNNLAHDYPKSSELAHLEQIAAGLPSDLKLSTKLRAPLPLSAPKKDKSGVIYLSRVPPFMKPAVLRSLLTPYGALGKIFLTPEPSSSRTQRLRGGGTRRKLFLDGWVEFLHKRDAKFVADNLNAQTMGGKKRGRWHDEVWNIKYLSGVKWNHITETIQNENAERTARMRVEISRGKAENRAFLENLEMGKMIEGVEKTRRDREERQGGEVDGKKEHGDGGVAEKKEQQRRKPRREFVQHGVTSKAAKKPEPGQDVGRVLSSMF